MKTNKLLSILTVLTIVVMAMLVVVACKKDDDGDDNNTPPAPENPLVGTYGFVSATFNQPITVIVNGDTNNYQAGDDAYIFVGGGLLGAAPCDNADNAALQLRNDFTSWYVCQNEANESQQGTWAPKVDNTVLTLNISDPADFVVNITELVLTEDKLTGTIPQLPMPYDTSIPVGDPLPGGGINFQIASVSVEFFILD